MLDPLRMVVGLGCTLLTSAVATAGANNSPDPATTQSIVRIIDTSPSARCHGTAPLLDSRLVTLLKHGQLAIRTKRCPPPGAGVSFGGSVTQPEASWESTLSLLTRARAGDDEALNDLFARYLPILRRWASGRLPRWARDLADTPDLVQETLIQVFKKMEGFEHRGEGALQAYLRQAVMNRIRNEIRNAGNRPGTLELDEQAPDEGLSPLEAAIGSQAVERYEAALQRLREDERELIVARLEMGLTYAELAAAAGKPSSDAARMAVTRAIARLIEEMDDAPGPSG